MYTVDAGMFSNHCELEESKASLTFTKEAVLDSIFAEYTILPICFAAVWMKKKRIQIDLQVAFWFTRKHGKSFSYFVLGMSDIVSMPFLPMTISL